MNKSEHETKHFHAPAFEDIKSAAKRISPHAHRTPVLTCGSINGMTGAELFFKCENYQKAGSFKFRGATNAVMLLSDEEASKGVATHSSGNHAQALALAAGARGLKAYIVMPRTASAVKVNAVRGYGGEVIFCEPGLQAREETLADVVEKTGAAFIHPYNDLRIITGQASAGMELIEDVPGLDMIIAPVGGGGLLSGTALSAHYLAPGIKVIAAEPEGADDACRSFRSGELVPSVNPCTIADGLLTSLGDITFDLVREYVHDILTVSEDNIIAAMKCIFERMKIVVEPSAAVPLGSVRKHKDLFTAKRVGIIISGGNADLSKLPWCQQTEKRNG